MQVVGFDEKAWTEINQPIHDRVEDRLQNTRFLTDRDAIVKRAETLLASKTSTWADLAVGLGVVIGRRLSELLGYRTKLEPNIYICYSEVAGSLLSEGPRRFQHKTRIHIAGFKSEIPDMGLPGRGPRP